MQEQIQKRVLVTGADVGLGLLLVKRFLQGGFAAFAGVHQIAVNWSSLTEEHADVLMLIPLDAANMGGQEATISPVESAHGIFQLATRAWRADAPIYIDYLGNPLPW